MSEHLTVAIPSYQRRESLIRTITALGPEADELRRVGVGVTVIVALDGSTDGSASALQSMTPGFELRVLNRPHRGRAAARNACLELAETLVLFLDDDLRPSPGLLLRHVQAHRNADSGIILGPSLPTADSLGGPGWRAWWADHWAQLESSGHVERFDQFTIANASGDPEIFRAVGGLDETFIGYGVEDYELGARLLAAGVPIRYDPQAVAWHDHQEDEWTAVRRQRSLGSNRVRLATRHPGLFDVTFPLRAPTIAVRLVSWIRPARPRAYAAASELAARVALGYPRLVGNRTSLLLQVAHTAAYAAGVADADPSLIRRALGLDS